MKFFISIILTALLAFATSLFFPWWVIALVGFVVAFSIPQKPVLCFISGFLALFILWVGLSFYISNANNNLLVHKMSILFIKSDNPLVLFFLTGLIGGIVAGFGSLTGRLFRRIVTSK